MAREIGQSAWLNTRFTVQHSCRRVNDREPHMHAKRLMRHSCNYFLCASTGRLPSVDNLISHVRALDALDAYY